MIIVKLIAWHGNQMFQYATARALAIKHNTDLYIDTDWFYHNKLDYLNYRLQHFNIQAKVATKKEKPRYAILRKDKILHTLRYPINLIVKILHPRHFIENKRHPLIHPWMFDFNPTTPTLSDNTYLEWFWQSEHYFKDVEDIIRKDFTLKEPISDPENLQVMELMSKTNSISLHVRRWDYVGSALGGICDKAYYEKAIEFIKSKVQDPVFFIFSNDIQRCKDNLNTWDTSHFIDWNKGENAYKDMILMSYCKHNIIANSSFSRRGARLNTNPNKIVIAPTRWHQTMEYKDTVPSEWIRL